MTECEDCGDEAKRRTRCEACGCLVCGWCWNHVHAIGTLARAAGRLVAACTPKNNEATPTGPRVEKGAPK